MHLRFYRSGFLKVHRTTERLAGDKRLTRLQQHEMILVGFQHEAGSWRDRNGRNCAHGRRSLAAINRMLFGEIRHWTPDPQERVRIIGTVLDRHQKRDVDPDSIRCRHPRLRNLQGLTATCGDGPNTQARRDERRTTEEKPFDTGTPTSNLWHGLTPQPPGAVGNRTTEANGAAITSAQLHARIVIDPISSE
jgi:hypothetical protein